MFKKIEIGEQPTMMNINAQAVWNEKKECWEVTIVSTEAKTCYDIEGDKYSVFQDTYSANVDICEEFVIAAALLAKNGINVKKVLNMEYNPITNKR